MHGHAFKQYIFLSYNTSTFILSVLTKILSHASVKRKQKGLRFSDFALLLVVSKWRYDSVKGLMT